MLKENQSECTLSVIMPVYNEESSLFSILEKVVKSQIGGKKEIVIVNDGSTDASEDVIADFISNHRDPNCKFAYVKKTNGGKGSAVRAGILRARGDIIIIQDADLEYEPNDYSILIKPILEQKAQVVYGSRQLGNCQSRSITFYLGGLLVTIVTNFLYGSSLTDEPTGYKVFKKDVFNQVQIKSSGFEWEPEVTAKILKLGYKIIEVPIHYFPSFTERG